MAKDFAMLGKKIFIRRLFKQDIDIIMDCYASFDSLYFNPMTPVFASEVLLYGEFWGAFLEDKIVGCCYFFNGGAEFFKKYNTYEAIADFTENMEQYIFLGYIYTDKEYKNVGIHKAFYNVAQIQGFHQCARYILHITPIKLSCNLQAVFESDFKLVRLRGLDNLVVHYVFAKSLYVDDYLYVTTDNTPQIVSTSNTKTLSKYLEHRYCGVDVFQDDNGDAILLKQLNSL